MYQLVGEDSGLREVVLGASGAGPGEHFNSHLQQKFNKISSEAGTIETQWTMFWISILTKGWLMLVMVIITKPDGGHHS